MRTLVIGVVCLWALSMPKLSAQLGGPSGGGSPRGGSPGVGRGGHPAGGPGFRPPGNFGLHPSTPFVNGAFDRGQARGNGAYGHGGYALPAIYPLQSYSPISDFGLSPDQQTSYQQPIIVVMAAPVPPEPPPPPPEPAKPVIREYTWPGPPEEGARTFSLALKDGTVRFAVAVWVQDGVVHYSGEHGTAGRAPLDAIDREATRRLNAEHGLKLSL